MKETILPITNPKNTKQVINSELLYLRPRKYHEIKEPKDVFTKNVTPNKRR